MKGERSEVIAEKCKEAACDPRTANRHYQLYVFEGWDPHPPQDFSEWLLQRHRRAEQEAVDIALEKGYTPPMPTPAPNLVASWNSDRERQEFYKSRAKQELPF